MCNVSANEQEDVLKAAFLCIDFVEIVSSDERFEFHLTFSSYLQ